MVASPDHDRRRSGEIDDLLGSIAAHAEFARLEARGTEAVDVHVQKILDSVARLRARLAPPSLADDSASSACRQHLLLVEDDEQVRQLMLRTLTGLGYQVTPAENGLEALEIVDAGGRGPDILVTDVIMPKLGGRELAVRLRLRDSNLKVLFVSGYTHGALDARMLRRPGTAFLQKPFTPRELGQALSALRERPAAKRA